MKSAGLTFPATASLWLIAESNNDLLPIKFESFTGIEIKMEVPDNLPQIQSDETRVDQILQNLVGNAVKFTEKGMWLLPFAVMLKIFIWRFPTPVSAYRKKICRIFLKNSGRLTEQPQDDTKAYGLGLAIAYKAAKMLGGDLWVKSVLGKGSTFTFTLPIKSQEVIPGAEPFVLRPVVEISPEQKTILVVDDEPKVVFMIADSVLRGIFPITATSGAQALGLAEKHRPFAVTLDVLMPDMDGFEVLERVRIDPQPRTCR